MRQSIVLPDQLITEINPIIEGTQISLDEFVLQAVSVYLQAIGRRRLRAQLEREYDELANMYDELAAELRDESWLPLENEALAIHLDLPLP